MTEAWSLLVYKKCMWPVIIKLWNKQTVPKYWHASHNRLTNTKESVFTKSRLHTLIYQNNRFSSSNQVLMWVIKMQLPLRKHHLHTFNLQLQLSTQSKVVMQLVCDSRCDINSAFEILSLILWREGVGYLHVNRRNSLNINRMQSPDERQSYKLNMRLGCWCKGYLSFCTAK